MEKIIKHIFLNGLFLGAVVGAAYGARLDTLKIHSLREAVDYALKTNPTLAAYKQQIAQARFNYKASESFIFPSVSGSFGGQDNLHLGVTPVPGQLIGKPGTTYYAQFGKKYSYSTAITVQKDFFNWQNIFQAKVSGGNYKLTNAQQEAYLQSLKEQVAKLYASVLVAQMSLQIAEKDKAIADSLDLLAKQRLDEGTTDQMTYNLSLINYNNVLQNMAQSQQLYDQGVENLKILFGEKPANELLITQQINFNDIPYLNTIFLGTDKSLQNYNEQYTISVLQAKLQKSAFLPKLSANYYLGAQQFQNDFDLSFNSMAWSKYSYIGLNLTVPIFTGFNTLNKYKSAIAQVNISKIQYDDAVNQSAINDRLLLKDNSDYTANTKASEANFKLYFQTLLLNQQKFKEGVVSLDVYLNAFNDYLKSENTLLNNLSTLLSNQATILSRQ